MKTFALSVLACLLVAVLPSAHADPSSMIFMQRNLPDTGNITWVMPVPSTYVIWSYDPVTNVPTYTTLGTGLSYSSGVLSATAASQVNADWNASSGVAQILNKPTLASVATSGAYTDLSGRPTLATVATSGAYTDLTGKPAIPPAITLTTTGTSGAATFNGTTGALNIPQYTYTPASRVYSYPTRALNTCFQVSSTRDAFVSYGVNIATILSLTTGQQGTVYLRTYTNNSCTTGAQEVARFTNGNTGTLTVGLSLTQNVTGTLSAIIPAGVWAQLVTSNDTGSPTFTAVPGEEVLQ